MNKAQGSPTKAFFVEMLTRDIELNDAILDLLDNCLDGVVRLSSGKNKLEDQDFYKGYRADIRVSASSFSIKDNCGGIPRDTAEHYAFRMGRAPDMPAEEHPTIGIYGIGMKRAIFKLGKEAIVHTCHKGEKYSVLIPKTWVNEEDWSFPIFEDHKGNTLRENGTEVYISSLNQDISESWSIPSSLSAFIEKLRTAIQQSYSLIIQKGFVITINGQDVKANPIEILVQKGKVDGVRPFIFAKQFDSVSVKLAIGFYAPMASEDEIDEMNESKRSSQEAGITIVCNDRVILYNDKSYLTGWGTAGVPSYHTQFTGIKGIVVFESSEPKDLPMTTTKRGVDHSSPVYIAVKDKICEGLKLFTNYTNHWKGQNAKERVYSTAAEKVKYDKLFSSEAQEFDIRLRGDVKKGKTYKPTLPKPQNDSTYRIIRFMRSEDEISRVKANLYGDPEIDISPSIVGEKCFDIMLDKE